MKIAVCLFAYNRPKYLRKAIKTHKKIEGLDYYAFIDYSETQKEVYKIIDEANIYGTIYQIQKHLGLNQNIISGIDLIFAKGYDAVIVLEDDLLLHRDALKWLYNNLVLRIGYIEAVSCQIYHPKYYFRCWAWGTWKDVWNKIDWTLKPDEKNRDSWDMIVEKNFRINDWSCRCPSESLVKHIGWSGIHYKQLDRFSIRRMLRKLF